MIKVQREAITIKEGMPERYSTKTLIAAFNKNTSSGRKEMFAAQLASGTIPINAETPRCDSSLAPEVLTKSSCVQVLRNTVIKVLGRFKHQLDTTIFYEHEGVVKVLNYHPYDYSRDWGVPNVSDLMSEDVPIGEEIHIDDYPFRLEAIDSYNPDTETLGYGINVRVITSVDRRNEEDGTYMSKKTLKRFACIKRRVIEVNVDDVFVKGFGDSVLPKIGEVISSTKLFSLIKASKYKTIGSIGADTLEDDIIVLAPGSFMTRVDVISNTPIMNAELERLRLERLEHRREVYSFLRGMDTDENFSTEVLRIMDDYKYEMFGDREIEYDKPILRINMCRLDVPGIGSKFTTTAGGKFTVDDVFEDGDYVDEYGESIDCIISASSIVKRENYSTPYFEKHINAINLHLHRMCKDRRVSPENLYNIVQYMYGLCGSISLHDFNRQGLTHGELFMLYSKETPRFMDLPESARLTVREFALIQEKMESYGIGRFDHTIKYKGIPLTSKHEVGDVFLVKLLNDVEFGAQMSGLMELDSRGYPVENSNTRLTGRSFWGVKPGKFSDLALNVLVNLLKNEYVDVLLNENDNFAMNEYMNAIGAEFKLTSNRDLGVLGKHVMIDEGDDIFDDIEDEEFEGDGEYDE